MSHQTVTNHICPRCHHQAFWKQRGYIHRGKSATFEFESSKGDEFIGACIFGLGFPSGFLVFCVACPPFMYYSPLVGLALTLCLWRWKYYQRGQAVERFICQACSLQVVLQPGEPWPAGTAITELHSE